MFVCPECDLSYEETEIDCPQCKAIEEQPLLEFITKSAITAQFITPKSSSGVDVELESKVGRLWPNEDEACFNLIKLVEKKFKNKNKFHSYLSKEDYELSKPDVLKKYIKGKIDFHRLVEYFMDALIQEAEGIGAKKITGGSVLFMHYKTQDDEDIGQLLAILVDKKSGFNFEDNETLKPINTEHLNLESIRQAVLFDLTLFDEIYPATPTEETYLKFIEGNSTGAFFKYAFGCNKENVDNVRSIDQLREAILEFDEKHNIGNDFYENAKRSFESEVSKAAKSKKSVSVDVLYKAIESNLPKDSKLKGTFKVFVATQGFEVNQHIQPTNNSASLGKYVEIESDDKSFSGKIIRKNIGTKGSNKPIKYDGEYITLRITNEKLRRELDKITEANEHDNE